MTQQTYTVNVTSKDIANGRRLVAERRCRTSCCPVALAVQRATKNPDWRITTEVAFVGFTPFGKVGLLKKVTKFIRAFDRERKVKPFSFRFRVPVSA